MSVCLVQPYPLRRVRLLDSPFRDGQEQTLGYLLRMDTERLLHAFRLTAGLPSTAQPMEGWERPDCELRGHFTGHYLSACALMIASTGDRTLARKVDALVTELARCQMAHGNGYLSAFPLELLDRVEAFKPVWAPWYTLHKIFAGLLDLHTLAGNRQALDVLLRLAAWADDRTGKLTDAQMQQMLQNEHGGMADTLWQLHALTGNPRHQALARRFEHRRILDPLMAHEDCLKGLHANTQIPKALAAACAFEQTGDTRYRTAVEFFWRQVVGPRTYATGGTSHYEYWAGEAFKLSSQLAMCDHECCCTHNLLKLARQLFAWTGDARYMDYYERALYNGILGTQDPSHPGAFMYYIAMRPGLSRIYCDEPTSYVCCSGTGIESFSKFGDSIYFGDRSGIYVNLFIPSELDTGRQGIRLRQETGFPDRPSTRLTIQTARRRELTLRLRIPGWATGANRVRINGRPFEGLSSPGSYLGIRRPWRDGDTIEAEFPLPLSVERMPDRPDLAAILCGPIVLAGELGESAVEERRQGGLGASASGMNRERAAKVPPTLVDAGPAPARWLKPIPGRPLTFRTSGIGRPADVTLTPFHRVIHQHYALYWEFQDPAAWLARQELSRDLPAEVIDRVTVGDAESEWLHNFMAYRVERGQEGKRRWVRSNDWFRYDLAIPARRPAVLVVTCQAMGGEPAFALHVDGHPVPVPPMAITGTGIKRVRYPLPADLTRGKERVAILFKTAQPKNAPPHIPGQPRPERWTPRVFALETRGSR